MDSIRKYAQPSISRIGSTPGALTVVLRTSIEPQQLVASSRQLVTNLDPDVPIFDVATMSERLQDSVWLRRAYA